MKQIILLVLVLSSFSNMNAQTKIGVVDSKRVMDTIPSRRADIGEIEMIRKYGEEEIRAMDSTLQAMLKEYNSGRNKVESPYVCKVDPESKIRMFQERIEERKEIIEHDLEMLSNDVNKRCDKIIEEATKIVALRLKLDVVVDSEETLYVAQKVDITQLVIIELLKLDATIK